MRIHMFPIVALVLVTVGQAQTFSVLYSSVAILPTPDCRCVQIAIEPLRHNSRFGWVAWISCVAPEAVFKITPSGELTVLHSFGSGPEDGLNPRSGLTLGTDRNFYGTTAYGGTYGYGTIFRATPSGKLSTLYNFMNATDGAVPFAPPIEGTDGNFYGTTCGCYPAAGTIYKITPSGTFTSLYQFNFPIAYPYAPLVLGTDGNFYGTVDTSGTGGIVFKITPGGKFTILHNFTNGDGPMAPLVQGSDGDFYSTTLAGGTGYGTIFKISASGTFALLHEMNGSTDGYNPYGGLVQATDDNFYGVNAGGGTILNCEGYGCGTIFKINPKGDYSVLYNFDYTEGAYPSVTLLQHTNGILYGDTWGGGISESACTQPHILLLIIHW
jgi:uncharacterized repeat protein (TIGR03803 family)